MRTINAALILMLASLMTISCKNHEEAVMDIPEADSTQIARVEPLSWWTGMETPLQLLIGGPNISSCDVRIEGLAGVSVKEIHKADSPNYLFADVTIKDVAEAGTCQLVFSKDGKDLFRRPYQIARREMASASRKSFTTDDLIYLILPDRFADGDPSNDSTAFTAEASELRPSGLLLSSWTTQKRDHITATPATTITISTLASVPTLSIRKWWTAPMPRESRS